MLRLGIVKSAMNEEEQEDDEDNLFHGTKVLKELVLTWTNKTGQFAQTNNFTSVSIAEELWKH